MESGRLFHEILKILYAFYGTSCDDKNKHSFGVSFNACSAFIFYVVLIEIPVSKQSRPWSDAAERGVWHGYALFALVPKNGTLRVKGLNKTPFFTESFVHFSIHNTRLFKMRLQPLFHPLHVCAHLRVTFIEFLLVYQLFCKINGSL